MTNAEGKIVITIGRQSGANGLEIGKQLAALFQIKYYDKSLLELAAKETGIDSRLFEKADEKPSNKLLRALVYNPVNMYDKSLMSRDELYELQANVIREIATRESCVIIGRTADYILRDRPNCFHFFIHAPFDKRVEHMMKQEGVTEQKAIHILSKVDKKRAHYYNYYTNKTWGASASYHLCIDSSFLGIEGTASFLKSFVERKLTPLPSNEKL